jgi:hypothetical protein
MAKWGEKATHRAPQSHLETEKEQRILQIFGGISGRSTMYSTNAQ